MWRSVLSGEAVLNHGFNFRPEVRIALALHVAGGNQAIKPGSCRAIDRMLAVIDQVISEDFGSVRIGGENAAAAVNKAVGLIEVDGLMDVRGDDGIVLP